MLTITVTRLTHHPQRMKYKQTGVACDNTLSKNDIDQAILPLKFKQNNYKTDHRVTKHGHTNVQLPPHICCPILWCMHGQK